MHFKSKSCYTAVVYGWMHFDATAAIQAAAVAAVNWNMEATPAGRNQMFLFGPSAGIKICTWRHRRTVSALQ